MNRVSSAAATRVCRRYKALSPRTAQARDQIMHWGEGAQYWPPTPNDWEDTEESTDKYGGVWAKEFVSTDAEVKVLVDFTKFIHGQKGETEYDETRGKVTWTATYWGIEKRGEIPVVGYERGIPKLLGQIRKDADQAKSKLVRRLEGLGGGNWGEGHFDDADLTFTYNKGGDASMGVTFEFILDVLSGQLSESEVHVHYSAGSDYEGHFGERIHRFKYRSLEDVPKVLRDAERLWAVFTAAR